MIKKTVKVVVLKKTKNPSKDRVIGEFAVRNFDRDECGAIGRKADRLFGAKGWNILQIWETSTYVVEILENAR